MSGLNSPSSKNETPAERIARKKRESDLRKASKDRELLWRSLIAHMNGMVLIAAQLDLGYKPDFKKQDRLTL